MKTLAQIVGIFCLVAAAGCFPESEGQVPNLSLRIPLDQLTGSPTQEALDNWVKWLSQQQAQRSIFQLDFGRQNFFLGLHLKCREGAVGIVGTDQMLSILKDNEGKQFLELSLLVDNGTACRFTTAIYLTTQPDVIELFSGASDEIPSLMGREEPVEINASLHPRSNALCTALSVGTEPSYRFAAMDIEEDVRLPPVDVKPLDGKVSFRLDGLPLGRQYNLYKASTVTGAEVWKATPIVFVLTTINGQEEICGQRVAL